MTCNVKNAPPGRYFTEFGYSQCYPHLLVKETPHTVTLQEVLVDKDPEWKPHIVPGGFCGHCDNQHEQTWLYVGLGNRTRTIRKTNKAFREEPDGPRYFYDYNF